MSECKKCDGTGYSFSECETCFRKVWVDDPKDGGTMTCPDCDGESEERCNLCDGTGEVDSNG